MRKEILNICVKEPFTPKDMQRYSAVGTNQSFTIMEVSRPQRGLVTSRVRTERREVLGDYSYKRIETEESTGFWSSQVGDFLKSVWTRRLKHTAS